MIEAEILAIDPGSTTGLCWLGWAEEIGHAEVPHDEVAQMFLTWVAMHEGARVHPVTVVVESFIIHPSTVTKSRQGVHDAIELIGLIRHSCEALGIALHLQTPAQGKRITNGHLKDAGLYVPRLGHARDAARHLYLLLAKKGLLR